MREERKREGKREMVKQRAVSVVRKKRYLFTTSDLAVSHDNDGFVGVHAQTVQHPEVLRSSIVCIDQLTLQAVANHSAHQTLHGRQSTITSYNTESKDTRNNWTGLPPKIILFSMVTVNLQINYFSDTFFITSLIGLLQ